MLNKIILGTVQFGLKYGVNNISGKPEFGEIVEILNYAFKNGISYLDTAEVYGNAHKLIGDYHSLSKNRFKVYTKFSSNAKNLPNSLNERVRLHINTMKIESIEGFMYHTYGDYKTFWNKHKNDLLKLKKEGLINKIGISVHSNEEIFEAIKNKNITFIQVPFNLLDNHSQRNEVFIETKKLGVEIFTRSVFLQGLFFKEFNNPDDQLHYLKKYIYQLKEISNNSKVNLSKLAIQYPISKSYIDKTLIGIDSINQLRENIDHLLISNEDLTSAFKKIDKIKVKEIELLNPALWNIK